jgi:Uma2 family endonuclease
MNASAFLRIDKAAFYAFVERQTEGRYEFVRGRIVQQMTGGTRDHGLVARRITRVLEDQLDAKSWTVLPERGVETAGTIRYPELVVEPADEPRKSLATLRPRIIVEVLSRSSTVTDLEEKPTEYLTLTSLEAYIVASQDEAACLVWARGPDGTFPSEPVEFAGADAVLQLSCGGQNLNVRFADIYRGFS